MNKKKSNFKELITKRLKLTQDQALITVDERHFDSDNSPMYKNLLEGMKKLPASVIIISSKKIPEFACLDDRDLAFKGADIMLFPSKDLLKDIKKAMENNTVPVCPHVSSRELILTDYDPLTEKGNAFLYKNINEWEMYQALIRALENYKFHYDWAHIAKLY